MSISLSPDEAKNKTISVGEFANFTATGHYDNDVTKNLTQKVDYTSSDPTVAEAPNTDGNKGKVNGLKPGVVTIIATDPETGISSNDSGGVNGHAHGPGRARQHRVEAARQERGGRGLRSPTRRRGF